MDQTSPCLMTAGLTTEPVIVTTPALRGYQGGYCALLGHSLPQVHSWPLIPGGAALLLLSPDTLCSVPVTLIPTLSQLILV